MSHNKSLKVARADGNRVTADVISFPNDTVLIRVPFIKEVYEDNPDFANEGKIHIQVSKDQYQKAIQSVEKYLEDLFLKGLSNEDVPASTGAGADSRGNEIKDTSGEVEPAERQGSATSVRSSARRQKQAKSDRGRDERTEMDESSGPSTSPED